MKRTLIVPGTAVETVAFAAKHFIDCAKEAIQDHDLFFVALSGGSTPKQIYQTLCTQYKTAIDWSRVRLFWSDERAVPSDHPDSNYKMAMDAGFANLPAIAFRMKCEGNLQVHAEEYEALIRRTLRGLPFDLIMLGVGEDGHTASLFPGTKGLAIKNKWVIANEVPQKKTWRMTFTYPLLNAARHTVFYAIGESKRAILDEVFTTEKYPASLVLPSTWILDTAANPKE